MNDTEGNLQACCSRGRHGLGMPGGEGGLTILSTNLSYQIRTERKQPPGLDGRENKTGPQGPIIPGK